MRVLVDVDGVVADFISALCDRLGGPSPDQIKHWSLEEALSVRELRRARQIMHEEGFCASIPWYEGAQCFLAAIEREARVYAVTAPMGSPYWLTERRDWLVGALAPERIIFAEGKTKRLIRGDVLIEDHPGNAASWLEDNDCGHALLIDRPWNTPAAKEWVEHERMTRVRTYGEALEAILDLRFLV